MSWSINGQILSSGQCVLIQWYYWDLRRRYSVRQNPLLYILVVARHIYAVSPFCSLNRVRPHRMTRRLPQSTNSNRYETERYCPLTMRCPVILSVEIHIQAATAAVSARCFFQALAVPDKPDPTEFFNLGRMTNATAHLMQCGPQFLHLPRIQKPMHTRVAPFPYLLLSVALADSPQPLILLYQETVSGASPQTPPLPHCAPCAQLL